MNIYMNIYMYFEFITLYDWIFVVIVHSCTVVWNDTANMCSIQINAN